MEYPISSNYVSAWTVQDATRELLQNAMDSGEWRVEADGSLVNKGTLRPEHFLLGCSEKASSDTIGQFGEGLKLALLVLARNGYKVFINSAGTLYTAAIRESVHFPGQQVLCIDSVEGRDHEPGYTAINTHPTLDWEANVLANPEGYRILRNNPKLYVKGLYVCDLQHFKHGYNFHPGYLKLGRDRNVVSDFDLAYEASRMIAQFCSAQEIAELVLDPNYQDAAYVNSHLHLLRKDTHAQLTSYLAHCNVYTARHSAKVLMESLGIAMTSTEARMHEWLEQNKKHMRSKARKAFLQLAKELR